MLYMCIYVYKEILVLYGHIVAFASCHMCNVIQDKDWGLRRVAIECLCDLKDGPTVPWSNEASR